MAPIPLLTPVVDIPGADALRGVGDSVGKAGAWLADRHNWIRVGWFTAGYAMVIAGLVILTKPAIDSTVGAVGGTVGKAVKAVV